jgi:transposase
MYQSDISREQFLKILPILESARKSTKPRKIELYEAFCGVLYILKSGCQWRMLPKDFPKWRSVHAYFQIWTEKNDGLSILEQVLQKLVQEKRKKDGRKTKTSFIIVDSHSVKNTDSAKKKVTMRAKKSPE